MEHEEIKLSFIEKRQLAFFKKFIFKMAAKSGCDWDGDILRIYVNESEERVKFFR